MTDVTQVAFAVSQGVDAIGMILHADSPRKITLERAQLIRQVVPAFVSLVGVFVDADQKFIERSIETADLDIVQLHGDENESFATSLSKPYIKAVRAKTIEQVSNECENYSTARGILLDPYLKGQHGGTGKSLCSTLWPADIDTRPLILAGGLSAENLGLRIQQLLPFAIDLNSGLETRPGVKDPVLVANAVAEVYRVDAFMREN